MSTLHCETAIPRAPAWDSGWAAQNGCRTSSKSTRGPDRARASASRAGVERNSMQTPVQTVLAVDDRSAVGEARRIAARLAEKLGFTEAAAGALAVVVTETATNMVKHAGRGELIFGAVQRGATSGIELLALDCGPGFANPARALRDGYSTAGSPGTGLGAIQRMASEFDMHSVPGKGMALRLVVWSRVPVTPDDETRIGSVCLPKSGEVACGDAWTAIRARHGHVLCMVDGLGHGADAAAAARTAIAAVAD